MHHLARRLFWRSTNHWIMAGFQLRHWKRHVFDSAFAVFTFLLPFCQQLFSLMLNLFQQSLTLCLAYLCSVWGQSLSCSCLAILPQLQLNSLAYLVIFSCSAASPETHHLYSPCAIHYASYQPKMASYTPDLCTVPSSVFLRADWFDLLSFWTASSLS